MLDTTLRYNILRRAAGERVDERINNDERTQRLTMELIDEGFLTVDDINFPAYLTDAGRVYMDLIQGRLE